MIRWTLLFLCFVAWISCASPTQSMKDPLDGWKFVRHIHTSGYPSLSGERIPSTQTSTWTFRDGEYTFTIHVTSEAFLPWPAHQAFWREQGTYRILHYDKDWDRYWIRLERVAGTHYSYSARDYIDTDLPYQFTLALQWGNPEGLPSLKFGESIYEAESLSP